MWVWSTFHIALNLYVSFDVGGVKKKTKPSKDRTPTWNEEFKLYVTIHHMSFT